MGEIEELKGIAESVKQIFSESCEIKEKVDKVLEEIESARSGLGGVGAGISELLFSWSKRFGEMQMEMSRITNHLSGIESRIMTVEKKINEVGHYIKAPNGTTIKKPESFDI